MQVIDKIRKALAERTDRPFPHVGENDQLLELPKDDDLSIAFAESFTKAGGKFVYCQDEQHLLEQLELFSDANDWDYIYCWDESLSEPLSENGFRRCRPGKKLDLAHASLGKCEALLAQEGSLMLTSSTTPDPRLHREAPVHIVIAYFSQVLLNMEEALYYLSMKPENEKPEYVEFICGPSSTRAIEMKKMPSPLGASELYLFFVDDAAMIPDLLGEEEVAETLDQPD